MVATYFQIQIDPFLLGRLTSLQKYLTRFRNPNSIVAGFNLLASPSTCMGMVLRVTIFAERH